MLPCCRLHHLLLGGVTGIRPTVLLHVEYRLVGIGVNGIVVDGTVVGLDAMGGD